VDYNFAENLRFFGRYSDQSGVATSPNVLAGNPTYTKNIYYNVAAGITWIINPTTVFDFKSAFSRENLPTVAALPPVSAVAWLAANPLRGVIIPDLNFPYFPVQFAPQNYSVPNGGASDSVINMWQQQASLSLIRGRNQMKFGFEWFHMQDYYVGASGGAGFTYLNYPTSDPTYPAADGNTFAAMMLGLPTSGARNLGSVDDYMRQPVNIGFYFQDQVRITPKLTADLGLRWEDDPSPYEKYNRLSDFQIDTLQMEWAGPNPVNGLPANTPYRSLLAPDWRDWAPRLGFSYQLTPKTVFRVGAGMFYQGDFIDQASGVRAQWPYAVNDTVSNENFVLPNDPQETYFQAYTSPQPGTPPNTYQVTQRGSRTPRTVQFSGGIERQLANNLLLEVRYVGLIGRHLSGYEDENVSYPGPGVPGTAGHPRQYQAELPGNGIMTAYVTRDMSNYNALQVKLDKRFSNGLQALVSYAWAHQLDTPSGTGFQLPFPAQNPQNQLGDYGDDSTNIPNLFTGSYIYDLPFGRSRRFLSQANSVENAILGGWEWTGIYHYQTGIPLLIRVGLNTANNGASNTTRPNLVPGVPQYNTHPPAVTTGFLNKAAYADPPLYTYGNLGRNTAVNPSQEDLDMGLYKNFFFRQEKNKVQFRAEFYNLPNQHWFGGFGTRLTDATFGSATNASPARIIQFALKLYW
jgi:hypothetical protein